MKKSFGQVFKETMEIKEAKICFIITLAGIAATAISPLVIKNDTALLIVIFGITSIMYLVMNRFNEWVAFVREGGVLSQDTGANKQPAEPKQNTTKKKKKKKKW
ncbi:MAG: hypothetical protein FWG10_12315 [Eubacteriaceae bacterium]|nr:hypothetical protein [Eubacteriaceae bacterium]